MPTPLYSWVTFPLFYHHWAIEPDLWEPRTLQSLRDWRKLLKLAQKSPSARLSEKDSVKHWKKNSEFAQLAMLYSFVLLIVQIQHRNRIPILQTKAGFLLARAHVCWPWSFLKCGTWHCISMASLSHINSSLTRDWEPWAGPWLRRALSGIFTNPYKDQWRGQDGVLTAFIVT